jgi:uncharacterized protein YegJ (DUF2314 family)
VRVNPVALVALLLLGCAEDRAVVHREGEPDVVLFDEADAEMEAAIKQARSTFPGFVAEMPHLMKRVDYFSIKVPIKTGASTEHIWLDAPILRDGLVTGALGNAPLEGSLELGDSVSIPIEEISDWMAVVDNELFGGYTVIIARGRMSQVEQEEFDASVGFRVPKSVRPF